MTRTVDFDAYRSEKNDEPVDFIIGGTHYALPSSLPASLAVDIIRMKSTMDEADEVPQDQMDIFGRSLFGETIWKDLLITHRITVDELSPLLEQVLEVYTAAPKEEAASPTSETPALASV